MSKQEKDKEKAVTILGTMNKFDRSGRRQICYKFRIDQKKTKFVITRPGPSQLKPTRAPCTGASDIDFPVITMEKGMQAIIGLQKIHETDNPECTNYVVLFIWKNAVIESGMSRQYYGTLSQLPLKANPVTHQAINRPSCPHSSLPERNFSFGCSFQNQHVRKWVDPESGQVQLVGGCIHTNSKAENVDPHKWLRIQSHFANFKQEVKSVSEQLCKTAVEILQLSHPDLVTDHNIPTSNCRIRSQDEEGPRLFSGISYVVDKFSHQHFDSSNCETLPGIMYVFCENALEPVQKHRMFSPQIIQPEDGQIVDHTIAKIKFPQNNPLEGMDLAMKGGDMLISLPRFTVHGSNNPEFESRDPLTLPSVPKRIAAILYLHHYMDQPDHGRTQFRTGVTDETRHSLVGKSRVIRLEKFSI